MHYARIPYSTAVLAGLLLSFILSCGIAAAEEDYELARKLRQQGEILPLAKILTFARLQKKGEVLDTELEKKHGRYIYEVEILDVKGQVWEVKLDAKTGQLVKIELDD